MFLTIGGWPDASLLAEQVADYGDAHPAKDVVAELGSALLDAGGHDVDSSSFLDFARGVEAPYPLPRCRGVTRFPEMGDATGPGILCRHGRRLTAAVIGDPPSLHLLQAHGPRPGTRRTRARAR